MALRPLPLLSPPHSFTRSRTLSHALSNQQCANLEFPAEWTERENVPRRSGLSLEDFRRQYERPNQPVILTDVVRNWPAFEKWRSRSYLNKAFENQLVHVGGYQFTMAQYYEYADEAGDEMPLYLFDKRFAEKSPRLAEDYHVPRAFSEDLFGVLGDCRPDYRWLIVGPKRSGSSFHKDPNATSAWNAVISGRKKWILFPPDFTPPGVHASDCGLHVATSVSIIEWFLNFYDEARDSEVRAAREFSQFCRNSSTQTDALTHCLPTPLSLSKRCSPGSAWWRPGSASSCLGAGGTSS